MKNKRNTVLIITCLLFGVLLGIAVFASDLNPTRYPLPSFISLFFPVLWLTNLLLLAATLFINKRISIIPFIMIIISYYQLSLIYNISFNKETKSLKNELKIITFNTGNADTVDLYLSQQKVFNNHFFSKTDIICLQEFIPSHEKGLSILESFKYEINVDYYGMAYGDSSGLSIYTNHEIIDYGWLKQDGEDTYALWSIMPIDGDTLLLINVQLQSIRLEDDEVESMTKPKGMVQLPSKLYSIYSKIKRGYKWREEQVQVLKEFICSSNHPVILCGDFNDPPSSYTYRLLSVELSDTFLRKGKGLGTTYAGKLPLLRLDYIMVDNDIGVLSFKKSGITFSDHLPLKVNLNFPK